MVERVPNIHTNRWAIVGAGRVGRTLGLLAGRLGISVAATWNREPETARATAELVDPEDAYSGPIAQVADRVVAGADVVWLTVTDDAIASVARSLAEVVGADQRMFHTAGSLSSEVLSDAGICGPVGSLHPLQSVTDPEQAVDQLGQVAWTVEGDRPAVRYARHVLAQIEVDPIAIESSRKPIYHAAAVTAANLLVALMDAAFGIAEAAGMSRRQARSTMVPLARSCLDNLADQDTADALSGPAARGDQATIDRHRDALGGLDDREFVQIYDLLTARAKKLADS